MSATLTTWAPRVRSILRIMTGLLLLEHGTQKYFNFPPTDMFAGGLDTLMHVAGGIELIGGVLIIVGLLTRPAAFICSGFAAAAYFMGHAPNGFFPILVPRKIEVEVHLKQHASHVALPSHALAARLIR